MIDFIQHSPCMFAYLSFYMILVLRSHSNLMPGISVLPFVACQMSAIEVDRLEGSPLAYHLSMPGFSCARVLQQIIFLSIGIGKRHLSDSAPVKSAIWQCKLHEEILKDTMDANEALQSKPGRKRPISITHV